ncbi:uncharacterized protein [Fopius arisanus]|uniref:EDR1/CTR1/ARMC3-like peptidase-like domain-containing protein n=2 Tax=Fopius arisanus TaxID=64838 RepID=A0A9R1TFP4_9HYME|nr:PREDICTED: uncharacterized protein LOC105269618 [Fopius arisanus]
MILNHESEKNHLHRFINILHNESDLAAQENLSKILRNFADDIFASYQILESPHLNSLLIGLQSVDPDVRGNCLEILDKLMANPIAVNRLSSLKWTWMRVGVSLRHLYEKIHREFRDSEGLEKLLEIFRDYNWEDLHLPVVEVLVVATGNYKTAEYFCSLINSEEVSELMNLRDPIVMQLMANLSMVPEFKRILQDFGVVQFISMNFEGELNPEIINPISSIIENICHSTAVMNELIEINVTGRLIEILKAEHIDWQMKEDAIFAIKEVISRNHKNGRSLISSNDHLSLIEITQRDVPMHVRLGLLNVINSLILRPKFRNFFVHSEIIEILSRFFNEQVADELKICTVSILSHLFIEEEARTLCLKTNFLERLCQLICTEQSLPVQSCAVQLIQQLCCDEILIDEFVRIGYLDALLKNRRVMRDIIPSWETCLQTMLSGHLPLKFAVMGRLSLNDITKNGFYVEKRHCHTFPSLKELLASRCSPIQCLYTVNFSNENISRLISGGSDSSLYWTDAFEDNDSNRICSSISLTCAERFGQLSPDPLLCQSLNMFLRILRTSEETEISFVDDEDAIDISRIESRAKLLGKFVAHKLSDVNESGECMSDKLKNHLQELRETLETSIIPIGTLRFGSYLERAVLFKIIGDRIGLPVALVRGEYGKSWVEVPLPQCHKESSRNHLPRRLLRPNYIVDLMDNPGDIIHVDSNRARQYYEYQPLGKNVD